MQIHAKIDRFDYWEEEHQRIERIYNTMYMDISTNGTCSIIDRVSNTLHAFITRKDKPSLYLRHQFKRNFHIKNVDFDT